VSLIFLKFFEFDLRLFRVLDPGFLDSQAAGKTHCRRLSILRIHDKSYSRFLRVL